MIGRGNVCLYDLNSLYVLNPIWQQGFSILNWVDNDYHITKKMIKNYRIL